MITLALQYDKHSGPDSVGQHRLTFTMDESINHGTFNPMEVKKGTQFLVVLIPAESPEVQEFASESVEDTKKRFWKQMHSLFGDIAATRNQTPEDFKETFKQMLKNEGKIKESTKELTLEQLAAVIIRLKGMKNANITNRPS